MRAVTYRNADLMDWMNPMDDKIVNFPTLTGKKPLGSFVSDLAQNVTAENYLAKATTFLRLNDGGFLIALADGVNQGQTFKLTPAQWGAWRAYFTQRKISVRFMDARGKAYHCFTVPAEWPHLFDSDASVQRDFEIGELFQNNYRRENVQYADAAARAASLAAMRLRFPKTPKALSSPASHLASEPVAKINMELLNSSHEDGVKGVHSRHKPLEPEF